ncbi:hypothetical protein BVRB_009510 [Beta vulgaris subsp. vulgaris]|uniref:Uncharacterized protein n=1 Tax=Beta vulgaris subsp. vulgaris TaxID=3555 RepID=A0A0J8B2U1_BETVV|nr:hypothetical protein BVRB_009510 [Beta vulgaris subsp. vulgaris]
MLMRTRRITEGVARGGRHESRRQRQLPTRVITSDAAASSRVAAASRSM